MATSQFSLRCLLFGEARVLFALNGTPQDHVDLTVQTGIDSSALLLQLRTMLPTPANELIDLSILAVNQEYVPLDAPCLIRPGDEVALIPPVSGG